MLDIFCSSSWVYKLKNHWIKQPDLERQIKRLKKKDIHLNILKTPDVKLKLPLSTRYSFNEFCLLNQLRKILYFYYHHKRKTDLTFLKKITCKSNFPAFSYPEQYWYISTKNARDKVQVFGKSWQRIQSYI